MSETPTNAVPNPGSDEALRLGCKCAVLDNAHGHGYMGQPGVFVYTEGCPVHWTRPALSQASSHAQEEKT